MLAAGGFIFLRGIIPALTALDTDFPNYYVAGVVARQSTPTDLLYDDAWFQEQIRRAGIQQQGKFSPFPPATALLFVPLSFLDPLAALRVLTLANMLALCAVIALLRRLYQWSLLRASAYVLLAGWGLANCFRFGQLYIILSGTILLSVLLARRQRFVAAGIVAASLLPVKYFSALLFVEAILRRRWKMIAAGALATIGILGASIALLGWEVHRQWIVTVLVEHLQGNLTQQNPFSLTFQSFVSLFRRLFVFDSLLNTRPLVDSRMLFVCALVTCYGAALGGALYAIGALRKLRDQSELSLAILSLLAILLAPATATYHFLLLWFPVAELMTSFHASGKHSLARVTLCLYAATGFIPYSFFAQFDGAGVLTLLAYPRLLLTSMLFVLSVGAARMRALRTQPTF